MTGNISKYKQKLSADFPELNIESIQILGTGWHHVALEVNKNIIFRLSREIHVKDLSSTVSYETEILRRLQNKLPIAIPNPQYIAPDNTYFGYPKLNGEILEDLVGSFSKNDWTQLIEDWVNIASIIHKEITIEEARKLQVPDFEGPDTEMAENIFNLSGVDEDILVFARKTIEQVKSLDMDEQQYVFIHNDLQFHNMLADSSTKRICGLIDWTDVCIAPIAREFATGEFMHGDRLERAAALYETVNGIYIDTAQARMWRALEEISDYVEEVESNESSEATKTMNRIKHLIAAEDNNISDALQESKDC